MPIENILNNLWQATPEEQQRRDEAEDEANLPRAAYPLALRDPVPEGEFTDRAEMVNRIIRFAAETVSTLSRSTVITARRRMGKTAVLIRAYNWLFANQDEVTPIYINLERCGKTLRQLGERYCAAFLRQYVAFRTQDYELARNEVLPLEEILAVARGMTEDRGLQLYVRSVDSALKYDRRDELYVCAIRGPASVAFQNEAPLLMMLDEFHLINDFKEKETDEHTQTIHGLYQDVVEDYRCPHLVTGSQVRMLLRHVLNGPLNGRFYGWNLEPLSSHHSQRLADKLSAKFQVPLSAEVKEHLARRTGGHPYYIRSLFIRAAEMGKDLRQLEDFYAVFARDLTRRGRDNIHDFWTDQMEGYFDLVAARFPKDRRDHVRMAAPIVLFRAYERMLERGHGYDYQALVEEEDVPDLAARANCTVPETYEILRALADCDLFALSAAYWPAEDPILREFITITYQEQVERLEQEVIESNRFLTELGRLRQFAGRLPEIYLEGLLRQFRGQTVPGECFHVTGDVRLPTAFDVTTGSRATIRREWGVGYEMDVFGRFDLEEEEEIWFVESKNWQKRRMSPSDLQAFDDSCRRARRRLKPRGAVVKWCVCTAGFTQPALDHIESQRRAGETYYYSDGADLNRLAKAVRYFEFPQPGRRRNS